MNKHLPIMSGDPFASETDSKEEPVVASPDATTPGPDSVDEATAVSSDGHNEFTIHRSEGEKENALQLHHDRNAIKERNNLHPYAQTLSISNLEDCVALENAVFPEHERCSREKVKSPFQFQSADYMSALGQSWSCSCSCSCSCTTRVSVAHT